MFVLSYTTIYYFLKKYIFFNVHILMNTISKCLYFLFGCERGHQLSTYATGGGMGEGHPKCVQLRTGGGGVAPHVHVRTCSISFHLLAAFLSFNVLFYLLRFNLTFIQKRYVRQKRLFFSNKINCYCHEIRFIYLKLFLQTKVSQNSFNFNQTEF